MKKVLIPSFGLGCMVAGNAQVDTISISVTWRFPMNPMGVGTTPLAASEAEKRKRNCAHVFLL